MEIVLYAFLFMLIALSLIAVFIVWSILRTIMYPKRRR